MKRLNLYVPPGKKIKRKFLKQIKRTVPNGVEVHIVNNNVPTICEVGWDLPPMAKMVITQELIKNIVTPFWARFFPWLSIKK